VQARGTTGRVGAAAGRYDSFVVRIWSRQGGNLHGRVEHAATRDSAVFKDLQALIAFVESHLREDADEAEVDPPAHAPAPAPPGDAGNASALAIR